MAEGLFLIRKTMGADGANGGKTLLNGIHSMIMNDDDAQTLAQKLATASGICNTKFGTTEYRDDYFQTADDIGDLTSGLLPADGDAVIFQPDDTPEIIA
jgi:hypothetical protein